MPNSRLALLSALALPVAVAGCANNDRMAPVRTAPAAMTQIGVNSYLYRAAVDTLSFAPLIQADSQGGVIITDWYSSPQSPAERVKITAAILDAELRADAVRVSVSRQTFQNGVWLDAPVSAATVQKLEDIILVRARDIRRTTIAG